MERKTQIYFRDNHKFRFRKLFLDYSSLLEKDRGELKRGWRHTFAGEYYFPGHKGMTADSVTLGFARDIFLDPHDKVPVRDSDTSGKPGLDNVAKWIARIATNQRQIYMPAGNKQTVSDAINIGLLGVLVLMVVGWLIRFAGGG
ncbi:hypothetical protein ACFLTZ_05965 [Chloroflexota bacterium]